VGNGEKMKSNIDKQIARIDQNLKLLIYSQQVRQELNRRKAFLNRVLDSKCSEVDENAVNFVQEIPWKQYYQ
jgi:hypothetical protein